MKRSGFTIVELLIVVVVIAILATLIIVSYQSIQAQTKTSVGLETASSVANKASVWQAMEGSYPDLAQLRTNSKDPVSMDEAGGAPGPVEARLDRPSMVIGAEMTEVRSESGLVVTYEPCWGGSSFLGARISYWDALGKSVSQKIIGTC